ncbi:ROK family transcriptional regulator [Paenibacillus soyae]|uniref:ROK family transcriptional regulator n=1 Tax=Paenibacillus soyae TaxID=2969249 RepID=A0A9X2SA45_9BACL|nr:ROK family transcriptional regulator [Paenibacillus soyae]MCR2805836.1 ROK family transcriptional regulator [Paenibacillus soyae]
MAKGANDINERPTHPNDVKNEIFRRIREALLAASSATKAELSQQLGISFPTVGKFLSRMEKEGEVRLAGLDDSSGGRRANRYAYNPEFSLGLAVFLEKAETNYTIFNCMGEAKEQGSGPGVLADGVRGLSDLIEGLLARFPKLCSLAIGVPGAVNNGRIIYIPSYEAFHQFDMKSYFEERLGIPVVVENDMNAAILGYHARRPDADLPSRVYVLFGKNGAGAGIMVGGALVRGNTSFSGEISFIPQYDDRNFLKALDQAIVPGDMTPEGIDAVSRLVAAFTAMINPRTIVFDRDEANEDLLSRIARRSTDYVPREHLPELVASDWRQDYLLGLQTLGLGLIVSGAHN